MILSKRTLSDIDSAQADVPSLTHFELPEKVLQFGTGVLLRGLPDYFIDKANKSGKFNGRVVVVKSTSKGDLSNFNMQDCLHTICVRGINDGEVVEENIISSAISRVIDANEEWDSVLTVAGSPDLRLIVSNTTEVGLVLVKENIKKTVPESYPGKLLSVLYNRFKLLGDQVDKLVVIATELVPDNGKLLHNIVLELISYNNLEHTFISWFNAHIFFCNSLVDRIVPGKPEQELLNKVEQDLGYKDELLIMVEPYRLWAIEGDDEIKSIIGLEGVDDGIIVQPDIEIFRELKVRLLNGTHTLASGIACLAGIETVSDAMINNHLKRYMAEVMQLEIIPSIPYPIEQKAADAFALTVLDRFSNPFIKHQWKNITFQYSMKLKIRIVPLLIQHYSLLKSVPERIAFGFAAYMQFMISDNLNGITNTITDDKIAHIRSIEKIIFVHEMLGDQSLWGCNLTSFEGFEDAVKRYFEYITDNGVIAGLALLH
jgi:tagaturonate reductase